MKTYIYFTPIPNTLEELKAAYRKLAFEHHPDRGGDMDTMKAVNNEYDALFPKLKDIHKTKDGETYTAKQTTTETPDQFKDLITELMKMDGIIIEVNLKQRDKLLPSEKAFAYKLQMEALQHENTTIQNGGLPSDTNGFGGGGQNVHQGKNRDVLADEKDETGRNIQRYIGILNTHSQIWYNIIVDKAYLTVGKEAVVKQSNIKLSLIIPPPSPK